MITSKIPVQVLYLGRKEALRLKSYINFKKDTTLLLSPLQ